MTKEELLQAVRFDAEGLVCCVMQDYHSKKVRMVAYMNREALEKTLTTKRMTYYSRSRKSLWVKGETSGYFQYLKGVSVDCDGDALLFQIEQFGGISCHTGNATCFYRDLSEDIEITVNRGKAEGGVGEFRNLEATVRSRMINPKEGSYTNYLLEKGDNKILKKIGEEATEVVIACKDKKREDIIFEISDLIYHLTVEMATKDISWADIENELKKR